MKYRKKPVVIEALQYDGSMESAAKIIVWSDREINVYPNGILCIHTLEGIMEGRPSDWIIRGVLGEYYPCKKEIFEATYEPAE